MKWWAVGISAVYYVEAETEEEAETNALIECGADNADILFVEPDDEEEGGPSAL